MIRARDFWLDVQLGVCLSAALVLALVGGFVDSGYTLQVLILTILFAVMGMGWTIAGGLAGQLLVGYVSFFGIGAYVNALLLTKFGISPWVNLLLAGGAGSLLGWVMARITLRFGLIEDYFGLFTVAVSQIFLVIFLNWNFAGRATGVYIMVLEDDFWSMSFVSRRPYLWTALGLLVLTTLLLYGLMRSRFGYVLAAVRENPDAAEALGIDVTAARTKAVVLSGGVAGVVGAFYAQFTTFIDPKQVFGLGLNFELLLAPILGGRLSLMGSLLGSFVLRPLKDGMRGWFSGGADALYLMLYGLVLIASILLVPNGIAGWLERRYRNRNRSLSTSGGIGQPPG